MNLFPVRFVTVGKIHGGYVATTYNSYVEIFFRYLKTFKIVLNQVSLFRKKDVIFCGKLFDFFYIFKYCEFHLFC